MNRVDFWGGPKDGLTLFLPRKPAEEYFCMELFENVLIDTAYFNGSIKDHPSRSQKYHKYKLELSSKPRIFKYFYKGLV